MRISRAEQLKKYFKRNGCYIIPDLKKRRKKKELYKKGYEVRLVALNYDEYKKIKKLLKGVGFAAGKAFSKARRRVIPIYGKESFLKFHNIIMNTKIIHY